MNLLTKLHDKISTSKKILITSHRNPDGDAVGSSLALYHYLKEHHEVMVAFPSEYPSFFSWVPEIEKSYIFDLNPDNFSTKLEEFDLVFLLDFNSFSRIDKMGELIDARFDSSNIVMIDHHINPDDIAELNFSNTQVSSTCELMYTILRDLNLYELSHPIMEILYLGLITDTGGFRYNSFSTTFQVAAEMIAKGVDNFKMQDIVFNNGSVKRLKLLGYCLYEKMEVFKDHYTGIIVLDKEEFAKYDIKRGDTEGVVNYILSMAGIKLAIFIREQPSGVVKLSFRSRGEFSVHELAKEHFGGGGHKNAAGGFSYLPLNKVVRTVKSLLPKYLERLENSNIYEN